MTRGRPFEPGNTFGRGRPPGSKNKSTSHTRRLLEQHHELLISKHIAEALRSDTKARQWCLDQLNKGTLPFPKLKLGPNKTVDDIAKNFDLILKAVANQKCTAALGQTMCAMLSEKLKMIEIQELAPRVEAVEELMKKLGGK